MKREPIATDQQLSHPNHGADGDEHQQFFVVVVQLHLFLLRRQARRIDRTLSERAVITRRLGFTTSAATLT
ncbi:MULTISPECIES: hypothetical protein [unclassified Burkholderia]|uniref:hypothetical protein n=1 Tax=unclassified Burkholderia TaxID=2613784 RepID=UPI00211B4124|nr:MULTISPECIES: hypothetical protein [unclassified Burkholderia]